MTISFRKFRPNAKAPELKTRGAAAYDLYVAFDSNMGEYARQIIPAGGTMRIPTGIGFALPSTLAGLVLPRSSWTDKLNVKHPPIDSDYRGEVHIIVHNDSSEMLTIHEGDRIAQIMLCMVMTPPLLEEDELPSTGRGPGGFGSTGGCPSS